MIADGGAEMINTEFQRAGFLVDKRELKVCNLFVSVSYAILTHGAHICQLHCTILNTTHRQPKSKGKFGRRIPFSFTEVCASEALRSISHVNQAIVGSDPLDNPDVSTEDEAGHTGGPAPKRFAVEVDLGTYDVDEIQICLMGSKGPEGEYVCVERIKCSHAR